MAKRKERISVLTVPGVASAQARVPARRECGREFHILGPTEQKDRSPTVFSLKWGTASVGEWDDLKARAGTKSFSSSAR